MHTALLLHRVPVAACGAVVLASLLAIPLGAQTVRPDRTGSELRQEAIDRVEATGDFVRGADLLAERAGEVAANELETARVLQLAARLYHHGGKLERARRALIQAGTAAYRAGAHELSVACLLDAAQIAAEDGNLQAAWRAADLAGYVVRTADLTPREKALVRARIQYAGAPVPSLAPTGAVAGR